MDILLLRGGPILKRGWGNPVMLEGQVEVLAHQLRRPPSGDLSQVNKAPTPNTHSALVLAMAFLISAPKVLKHCLPMPRVPAELSIGAKPKSLSSYLLCGPLLMYHPCLLLEALCSGACQNPGWNHPPRVPLCGSHSATGGRSEDKVRPRCSQCTVGVSLR